MLAQRSTEVHRDSLPNKRLAEADCIASSSTLPSSLTNRHVSSHGANMVNKRMRLNKTGEIATQVARHPLGIRPLGNAFFAERDDRRTSLGLFARFDDEFLLNFWSSYCNDPYALAKLEAVSRGMYVFVNGANSIWKDAFLSKFDGRMVKWCGSWKRTLIWHLNNGLKSTNLLPAPRPPIQSPFIFSDVLYHPFRLSMAPLNHLVAPACPCIPIDKLDLAAPGSVLEFRDRFARANRPAILQNTMLAKDWPCRDWSLDKLAELWPNRQFQCEAIKACPPTYLTYSRGMQRLTHPPDDNTSETGVIHFDDPDFDPFAIPDESPFYLFDASFADDPRASVDWRVPAVFQQAWSSTNAGSDDISATRSDLFSLLGPLRPDYRWIIAGPARSGSGWHKDPNGTSAWNAVLTGRKAWMMLPPHVTPPGVYVSEDEAEVTAPLSIAEWLLDFAKETRRLHGPTATRVEDRVLLEGVCEEGEVLYVPSGWWHLVLNLEESVALTQNFVSPAELGTVLEFMKNKPDQLSGFKKSQSSNRTSIQSITDTAVVAPETQPSAAEDDECEDGADFNVFDMFCERLASFDRTLLDEGLSRVAQIESSPMHRSNQRPQQRAKPNTATGSDTWWERLKKSEASTHEKEGSDAVTLSKPAQKFSLASQILDDELEEVPW